MNIGIDARMMGPEQGGLGRYVEQLITHLLEIDRENQYVFFVCDARQGLGFRGQGMDGRVRIVIADIPWYGWEEQVKFPGIIKKEKIDLMHFPHWNVPLLYRDPYIVTVHDLIMWHYPRQEASTHGPFIYWLKDRLSRLVVTHAVRRAKHVIVTSEYTKHDIHETLHVPMEKMTTIYQAPFVRNPKSEIRNPKYVLQKYQSDRPYALYVGSAYPHKNLERLLQAWTLIEEKYGDAYQLVLVGKESFFYDKLKKSAAMKQCAHAIHLGFVPDDELESLYAGARLYVFPSLYEGFGLPPLEAMAHGVPVVSSNRSCLPEVLGEAALYADPEYIEQMAAVIEKGLADENIRCELKERALIELRRYSWEQFARQTLLCYTATA